MASIFLHTVAEWILYKWESEVPARMRVVGNTEK